MPIPATSLLGAGGEGVINPTQNSYANAAILFDSSIFDSSGSIVTTPDGAAANAYTITNNGTTGEPVLRVSISNVHKTTGVPVYPGERIPFVVGSNSNGIATVRAWINAPGSNGTSNAATALSISGGIQRANS